MTRLRIDLEQVLDTYLQYFGALPPTSPRIREHPEEWVRFHSFPALQRYPDDDADRQQLLHRHSRVIRTLRRQFGGGRLVGLAVSVTPWWGEDENGQPKRIHHRPTVLPGLRHMFDTFDHPYSDDGDVYGEVYATDQLTAAALRRHLLRQTRTLLPGIAVIDETARWVYAPYDGGADVLLTSSRDRDLLRRQHAAWLSPLRSGL
ncbi:DUF3885 domain-containing protein [Curtobacterium citreum]